MSYIRSTTNPEGLYIWGDDHDVSFSYGSMGGEHPLLHAPFNVWHGVLKKCGDDFLCLEDFICYEGMFVDTGSIMVRL